jgi:hypothetical protein
MISMLSTGVTGREVYVPHQNTPTFSSSQVSPGISMGIRIAGLITTYLIIPVKGRLVI